MDKDEIKKAMVEAILEADAIREERRMAEEEERDKRNHEIYAQFLKEHPPEEHQDSSPVFFLIMAITLVALAVAFVILK